MHSNILRRQLNEAKAIAFGYYSLFKRATTKEVKRKAGLAYLRMLREIREREKEIERSSKQR